MATSKIRGTIERLLQDLDKSESGGVDAALAAASHSSELEEYMTNLKESYGVTPLKSRGDKGHMSDDDLSTTTEDTDQATPGLQHRRGVHGERYAYMERKALQLMADNKALMLALEQTTRRKDMEIKELQAHISTVVKELEDRHKELESKAPLLRLRAEEFRDQLRDLRLSDARYAELRTMAKDSLSVVDEVKMAVFEETSALRKENERLRLTLDSTREMAARAEEEAARLRVENSRISATLVDKEKDLQLATDSLQARVERLASELESSMVRCELLSAKGQMYDELRTRADKIQEENQRLQVVEMGFKRLEEQSRELQLYAKDKEHTNEMLLSDKAYLSKQVELLSEVQQRLQSEVEVRDAKITDLQKKKQELFDKLIQTETLKNKQEESRLQRELAQLQSGTQASIEKIRVETGDAYEREARLLRELRDQAQEDAARTKIQLRDVQAQYEQLQLQSADSQRKLEGQVVELQAELRNKTFELSHLNVILAEKEALLQRANVQNDLLQEKLQVSMEQYRALESDIRAAAAAGLPASAGVGRVASAAAAAPPVASLALTAAPAVPGEGLPELRVVVRKLEEEKAGLTAQVKSLEASLRSTQSALQLAGQPHGFLLEQLQSAKTAAQQSELRAVAATTALKAKEQEAASAVSERDALRQDLELLLQQRGQLETLKAMLIRTLGGGGSAAPGPGASGPGIAGRSGPGPTVIRPPTTIVGERQQ